MLSLIDCFPCLEPSRRFGWAMGRGPWRLWHLQHADALFSYAPLFTLFPGRGHHSPARAAGQESSAVPVPHAPARPLHPALSPQQYNRRVDAQSARCAHPHSARMESATSGPLEGSCYYLSACCTASVSRNAHILGPAGQHSQRTLQGCPLGLARRLLVGPAIITALASDRMQNCLTFRSSAPKAQEQERQERYIQVHVSYHTSKGRQDVPRT